MYWLGRAYSQVIDGETSVEEALDTAQKTFEDYRACGITKDVFTREEWQACLREVDASLQAALFGESE